MFDHISAAAPKRGKLRRVTLDNLPGSPSVDLEHLGDTNESWLADQIARANSKESVGVRRGKITKKTVREITDRKREELTKHGIRHLHATRKDGTPATDENIPIFVEHLPAHCVERLYDYAKNADNYLEVEVDSPADDVAGK